MCGNLCTKQLSTQSHSELVDLSQTLIIDCSVLPRRTLVVYPEELVCLLLSDRRTL